MKWVLVLGDAFVDRLSTGDVYRCSPEAPVPVIVHKGTVDVPGGAGNVAMNLVAMGVHARYYGGYGNDANSRQLYTMLHAGGVDVRAAFTSERPTAEKHRIVAGQQQLVRIDTEYADICEKQAVLDEYTRALHVLLHDAPSCVVVADYGKGGLDMRRNVISNLCKSYSIPLFVDTKPEYLSQYGDMFILKPNLKEAREMVRHGPVHPAMFTDDVSQHGIVLARALRLERPNTLGVCVTLGEAGAVFVSDSQELHVPAPPTTAVDVTGAGDTFFAGLVAGIVNEQKLADTLLRAVTAAAISVTRMGTTTVTGDELEDRLLRDKGDAGKLMTTADVAVFAARRRRAGCKIGFVNGCFDLMHPGHVHLLREARQRCDVLIAAVNSDDSIRRLKGPNRPIGTAELRRPLLLPLVDALVEFDEDTPIDIIKAVHPTYLFKGEEYLEQNVVGADWVAARGGELVLIPMLPNFSTTQIAEALRGSGTTV